MSPKKQLAQALDYHDCLATLLSGYESPRVASLNDFLEYGESFYRKPYKRLRKLLVANGCKFAGSEEAPRLPHPKDRNLCLSMKDLLKLGE